MPPITVQLPNGQTAEFPDGMSPAEIQHVIETDPNSGYAPSDNRNAIQKSLDADINNPLPGPKALDSFGRGAAQSILGPVSHPIEAAKGFAKSIQPDHGAAGIAEGLAGPAGPLVAHTVKGVYDDYKKNGLAHALGNVAGGFMAGEATGGLARGLGSAAKATGAGIDNVVLGTTAKDVERGANPGSALSSNRIWGSNPNSLLAKVNEVVPEAARAHNADIARFTRPGAVINTAKLASQPFDSAIQEATNPITGVAMPAQIAKTVRTRNVLTHELDPNTGQITPALRNPNMSPLEANRLKSNIYGLTDYDNPSRAAMSNAALKGAARNIKTAIEKEVPEATASGQRLHDLMSAKDILTPQANGTKLMPISKHGLLERAGTAAATGGAAALDTAGGGLRSAGSVARYIAAPSLISRALYADDDAKNKR